MDGSWKVGRGRGNYTKTLEKKGETTTQARVRIVYFLTLRSLINIFTFVQMTADSAQFHMPRIIRTRNNRYCVCVFPPHNSLL